ncbi:hypothetical protein [Streptomyces sp. NPDC003395]
MNKLRRIAAGLALATAAVTGLTLADHITPRATMDTTWGAPAGTDDTTWGTPPTDGTPTVPVITPLDTTWG